MCFNRVEDADHSAVDPLTSSETHSAIEPLVSATNNSTQGTADGSLVVSEVTDDPMQDLSFTSGTTVIEPEDNFNARHPRGLAGLESLISTGFHAEIERSADETTTAVSSVDNRAVANACHTRDHPKPIEAYFIDRRVARAPPVHDEERLRRITAAVHHIAHTNYLSDLAKEIRERTDTARSELPLFSTHWTAFTKARSTTRTISRVSGSVLEVSTSDGISSEEITPEDAYDSGTVAADGDDVSQQYCMAKTCREMSTDLNDVSYSCLPYPHEPTATQNFPNTWWKTAPYPKVMWIPTKVSDDQTPKKRNGSAQSFRRGPGELWGVSEYLWYRGYFGDHPFVLQQNQLIQLSGHKDRSTMAKHECRLLSIIFCPPHQRLYRDSCNAHYFTGRKNTLVPPKDWEAPNMIWTGTIPDDWNIERATQAKELLEDVMEDWREDIRPEIRLGVPGDDLASYDFFEPFDIRQ